MSDTRDTPVAEAHYEKVEVPLNSFNADMSLGRPTSQVRKHHVSTPSPCGSGGLRATVRADVDVGKTQP